MLEPSRTEPQPLTVDVEPRRQHVVVAPAGELDIATTGQVARELDELRATGFRDLVLDLRGLDFIDSSGLRLLLEQARAWQEAGCRLRLIDGSPTIRKLFELTGTRGVFEFVDARRV